MKNFNLTIIIFILITILGLIIRYCFGENSSIWQFWSNLDISFAVALGILAFFAYKDMIKDEDKIKLYFRVNNELKDTNLTLLRKDCTRGEILGVLGMMQTTTKERFKFNNKNLPKLLQEAIDVQKGKKDIFVIDMTTQEFEQFII